MKINRKILVIASTILVILIALDFIPIKFAIKPEEAQMQLKEGKYICHTEPKIAPPIRWIAKKQWNAQVDNDVYINISGDNPNNTLSVNEFDVDKWFELDNAFLLIGTVEKYQKHKETTHLIADLNVENWEIIYPIKRASIRKYYAPKGYLTVYDYNWMNIVFNRYK